MLSTALRLPAVQEQARHARLDLVDRTALAAHIAGVLAEHTTVTLRELTDVQPLSRGLAELVAYLDLGSSRFHMEVLDFMQDGIRWTGAEEESEIVEREATMQRVLFKRGRHERAGRHALCPGGVARVDCPVEGCDLSRGRAEPTDFVREHMLQAPNVDRSIGDLLAHFDDLTQAHAAVTKAKDQVGRLEPLIADCDAYEVQTADMCCLRRCRDQLKSYFSAHKCRLLAVRMRDLQAEQERLIARKERRLKQKAKEEEDVQSVEEGAWRRRWRPPGPAGYRTSSATAEQAKRRQRSREFAVWVAARSTMPRLFAGSTTPISAQAGLPAYSAVAAATLV